MTITLPAALPQCALREGWAMRPISPLRQTDMDDGDVATTRKLARIPAEVSMTWEMDAVQQEIALDFWARDLGGGDNWFLAPIAVGTGVRLCRAKFLGDPPFEVTSPANGIFRMRFDLTLFELPVLTAAQRMAFEAYVEALGETGALEAQLAAITTALEGLPTWG